MSGTISNVVIPNGVATENNKNSNVLLVNFGMASLTSMQVEDTNTQTHTYPPTVSSIWSAKAATDGIWKTHRTWEHGKIFAHFMASSWVAVFRFYTFLVRIIFFFVFYSFGFLVSLSCTSFLSRYTVENLSWVESMLYMTVHGTCFIS